MGDEGGNVVVQDLRAVVEKTVAYQPHNRFVTRLAFSCERSVYVCVQVCLRVSYDCVHVCLFESSMWS